MNRSSIRLVALAALLLPGLRAQEDRGAGAASGALETAVRARLEAIREERGLPGVTAAFELRDGRRGAVAVGLADVEAERPMTVDSKTMSGSVGKMLFAVAILRAADAGELDLDARIARWVGDTDWFARLPNGADLTLRMLLRHRSGVPEHVRLPEFWEQCRADPDRVWAPAELVAFVLDDEPLFPADSEFAYADTNYVIAGIVHETATGRRIYDDVRRIVLEPLALRDTVPSVSRSIPGLATGYGAPDSPFGLSGRVLDDEGRFRIQPQMEWTGGGFAWTARDLARFGHALFTTERLLSGERRAEMLDAGPAGRLGRYGLGVIVGRSALGPWRGHTGFFPGYLCQLAHFPEAGVTVAIGLNTDELRKVGPLQRIVDDVAASLRDAAGKRP